MDENGEIKKPTKWYMGQYANNDGMKKMFKGKNEDFF